MIDSGAEANIMTKMMAEKLGLNIVSSKNLITTVNPHRLPYVESLME